MDSEEVLESDASWVSSFRRGDRAALERVFLAYSDLVAKEARKSRLPEHEVEAVVHDVFIKAFAPSARTSWDGIRPYGAWLRVMTKNLLVDRYRHESRAQPLSQEQVDGLILDERDPAEHHDDAELYQVLSVFQDGLTQDEKNLFHARYEEGRSLVGSAEALGWSEIRVRRMDTSLRTRLLFSIKRAGFLQSVDVKIGSSLLRRPAQGRRKA
jgi:RNA polymerase sigma-70 factor (ECF subfamily)